LENLQYKPLRGRGRLFIKLSNNFETVQLEEGWNLVETDTELAFPSLIKQFAAQHQKILWLDSSNKANTHHFESSPKLLEKLDIARAFTAMQHYSLCKEISGYDLIVAPDIDRLYTESSLYRTEAVELFEDAIESINTKVIYSTASDLGLKAREKAANTLKVESTSQGLKYSDRDTVTKSYRQPGCIQTTVPAYGEVNKKKWEEPIKHTETV